MPLDIIASKEDEAGVPNADGEVSTVIVIKDAV